MHSLTQKMNNQLLHQFDLSITQLTDKIKQDKKQGITQNNNPFRLKALKVARQVLGEFPEPIYTSEQVKHLPGIGEGIVKRIDEILQTGVMAGVQQPETTPLPSNETTGTTEHDIHERDKLVTVIDIGASMATKLLRKQITLERLLEAWKVQDQSCLSLLTHGQQLGVKHYQDSQRRIPRELIVHFEQQLRAILYNMDPLVQYVICGSFRRGASDSGDIDVLLTHPLWQTPELMGNALTQTVSHLHHQQLLVDDLTVEGNEKYMGFLQLPGMVGRIDILCMPFPQYVPAMLYFTGSKAENIRLRKQAIKLKMKLNQMGLYQEDGTVIPIGSELEMYEKLHLPYKFPNER